MTRGGQDPTHPGGSEPASPGADGPMTRTPAGDEGRSPGGSAQSSQSVQSDEVAQVAEAPKGDKTERRAAFGTPAIQALLDEALARHGAPLPFWRFMELVLYHPEQGYYMRPRSRIGAAGDFVTAPEITSLFGELLTLQWVELWQAMGSPGRFDLVELGGGSGRLAADILATARRFAPFDAALRYHLVERSPDFIQRQRGALAEAGLDQERVRWLQDAQPLAADGGVEGAIFSNEFFDALPVRWVEMGPDGLGELGVARGAQGWEAVPGPLGPGLSPDHFSRRGVTLEPGARTEIGLEGIDWMARLGTLLKRGMILTIDYGHPARELRHPLRRAGTLAGHRNHERVDDPLRWPGEMDLTAHVDFTALAEAGRRAGLVDLGFTTQGWFLMGLGILERLEAVLGQGGERETGERLKQAVMRLTLPEGMGERFKVLAQGRGLDPGWVPAGFRLNDQQARL